VDEILKVRLQCPPGTDFILVDRRHQRLGTSKRPVRTHQLSKIDVECAGALRDMGIRRGDAKLVLGALIVQSDKLYATVGVEVDQVAI
jgi:hypothetical protein